MTTADDVIRIANKWLNYVEAEKNDTIFGAWFGLNYEPWCAMFVSYCFEQAKLPLSASNAKGFADCLEGINWFRQNGCWKDTPQRGDVVFFDWHHQGTDSHVDHVGIVEKVNLDGSVETIEGNTSPSDNSNGGQVMHRHRNPSEILGFGRPAYDGVPISSPSVPPWIEVYIKLTTPNVLGEDIRLWQRQMIELGYDLGAGGATGQGDDGCFGPRCDTALKKFQAVHQLKVDGILGQESWKAAWLSHSKRVDSLV